MVSQVPNLPPQTVKFRRVGAAAAKTPMPANANVSSQAYKGLAASSSYDQPDEWDADAPQEGAE